MINKNNIYKEARDLRRNICLLLRPLCRFSTSQAYLFIYPLALVIFLCLQILSLALLTLLCSRFTSVDCMTWPLLAFNFWVMAGASRRSDCGGEEIQYLLSLSSLLGPVLAITEFFLPIIIAPVRPQCKIWDASSSLCFSRPAVVTFYCIASPSVPQHFLLVP